MNDRSATIRSKPARRRVRRERRAVEFAHVQALERHDARIAAQPLVQLAMADVEADHLRRTAGEQHVGEAAGALPGVEAGEPGHVEPDMRAARRRA